MFGSLFAGVEAGVFAGLVVAAPAGAATGPNADFSGPAASQDVPLIFGDEN